MIDTLVGMFYETFSFCVRVDFVAMHFAPATATLQVRVVEHMDDQGGHILNPMPMFSTQENPDGTDKPRHIHVLESASDPADSIYGIALIAAVGTALTMVIIGFAFGWYT